MTKKISVSLPDELEQAARRAAESAGVPMSTWLARAVRRELEQQAILAEGRAAIAEEIAEHGPIEVTPEEEAWVDRVLESARLFERRDHRAAG